MKPRLITTILLFISAYAPLFIILCVKDYNEELNKINHPKIVAIVIALTILCVLFTLIVFAKIKRGNTSIEILSVNNRSVDLINYTIPYMVSFLGIDLSSKVDIINLIVFLVILLILTITSKSIFINPILALFGYGFYDINYKLNNKTYSTTVISKIELTNNDTFYIRGLTRFLFLITEKKSDVGKE